MIILPSVLYGLHVVWGGSLNVDLLNSLEILHRRVARVIYNLPERDMRTGEVYRRSKLHTLTFYSNKLRLIKMLHSVWTSFSIPIQQKQIIDFLKLSTSLTACVTIFYA